MNTQKQRRVQFPKRFTFTRVLARLNCALALAEFVVVFFLLPSALRHFTCCCTCFTIQFVFCFASLFFYSLLFVCFSSASANYRIQLIYLLAILDPSFTRGGARSSGCTVSISPWWIVDRLMDCVKRGSGPEISSSSSTSGLRAWLSRHRNWVCALV